MLPVDYNELMSGLALLSFFVFWYFVLRHLAKTSGWRELAGEFSYSEHFNGKRWRFQSIWLKEMQYGSCLQAGVSPSGFYLFPMLLFRPGHDPLLIPWDEMEVEPTKMFGLRFYRLRLKKFPDFLFRINGRLYRRLESFLKPRH